MLGGSSNPERVIMACDFTRYNELRDITRNKAADAQAACAAVSTAQDGLVNAQDAYDAAVTAKDAAYAEWELVRADTRTQKQ